MTEEHNETDGDKVDFPALLHRIVSDPNTDHCIHWLPGGTHFFISDKKKFAQEILPLHYNHTKFPSFIRRLKRWGFIRVPSGPLMGAYYNPNFKKGDANRASLVKYSPQVMLAHEAMRITNSSASVAFGAGGIPNFGAHLGLGLGRSRVPETDSYLDMNSFSICHGLPNNVGSSNTSNALLQSSLARGIQHQSHTIFPSQPSNHNFFPKTGMGNGVSDAASLQFLKQRLIQMGANGWCTSPFVSNAFSASRQNTIVLDQLSRSTLTPTAVPNGAQPERLSSALEAKKNNEQRHTRRLRNQNNASMAQDERRSYNACNNFVQNGSDFDVSKSAFNRGA
ncbi:hypothetical protein ACHAXS_006184 [Conticribra weissflogii]